MILIFYLVTQYQTVSLYVNISHNVVHSWRLASIDTIGYRNQSSALRTQLLVYDGIEKLYCSKVILHSYRFTKIKVCYSNILQTDRNLFISKFYLSTSKVYVSY